MVRVRKLEGRSKINMLRPADHRLVIEVGGSLDAYPGSTDHPDLVLEGTTPVVALALFGNITLAEALAQGLQILGDRRILGRIQPRTDSEAQPRKRVRARANRHDAFA